MRVRRSLLPPGAERREHERVDVRIEVDYATDDTSQVSTITNISEMGIFVRAETPLSIGTPVKLRFDAGTDTPLELRGTVAWVNPTRAQGDHPDPGMGIRFDALPPKAREAIIELIARGTGSQS